jgi:hypothetical protein
MCSKAYTYLEFRDVAYYSQGRAHAISTIIHIVSPYILVLYVRYALLANTVH